MNQSSATSLPPGFASQTSRDPFRNPFDQQRDHDEHTIWDFLVAVDADAFAESDFSMIQNDFAVDRFEGIDANGSLNPADWRLRYPAVDDYRADWLEMAKVFLATPLADVSHRELLYKMTHVARIELAGDRAIVRKCFFADEQLEDGGRYELSAQSIYRLHRIDGRWLIAGFVGYLPLEPLPLEPME